MTAATVDAIDLNVVHELKMSAPDMDASSVAILAPITVIHRTTDRENGSGR